MPHALNGDDSTRFRIGLCSVSVDWAWVEYGRIGGNGVGNLAEARVGPACIDPYRADHLAAKPQRDRVHGTVALGSGARGETWRPAIGVLEIGV